MCAFDAKAGRNKDFPSIPAAPADAVLLFSPIMLVSERVFTATPGPMISGLLKLSQIPRECLLELTETARSQSLNLNTSDGSISTSLVCESF